MPWINVTGRPTPDKDAPHLQFCGMMGHECAGFVDDENGYPQLRCQTNTVPEAQRIIGEVPGARIYRLRKKRAGFALASIFEVMLF